MPQSQSVTDLKINQLTSVQYDDAVRQGIIGDNELSILTDVEYPQEIHVENSSATGSSGMVLMNNWLWNNTSQAMTFLTINGIQSGVTASFRSQVNFSSGSTPTNFTYPAGIIWRGDDVSGGVFTPAANKRYCITFTYDGVSKFRASVEGASL